MKKKEILSYFKLWILNLRPKQKSKTVNAENQTKS